MSSALAELWQTLPTYIVEFVGHQASHAVWEQHLVHSPVIAMQPNWQMLDANEAPELTVWGLQSITLHTAISEMGDEWPGAWPSTLPAAKAGIAHSNACFGEPLLHAQNIALYQIQSPLGLDWVAQCMFTSQGGLQHLSFIKMHDWKPLLEKYVEASPAVSEPEVGQDQPLGLCAAGSLAPREGWYEAVLPNGHPMQVFFAHSDIRLVFREKGEHFPALGVTPKSDEILVQWSWLRAN